eukprot:scpid62499/ scgid3702/ Extracellular matrix protein FRAS1
MAARMSKLLLSVLTPIVTVIFLAVHPSQAASIGNPLTFPDTPEDPVLPPNGTCFDYSNGGMRSWGERWPFGDCGYCRCEKDGGVGCMSSDCLNPTCQDGYEIVDIPGQCCDECKKIPDHGSEDSSCTGWSGERREAKETWHPYDFDCAVCKCGQAGRAECNWTTCETPVCEFGIVDVPGQCCHTCREAEGCVDDTGVFRRDGSHWFQRDYCTVQLCQCSHDRATCTVVDLCPQSCQPGYALTFTSGQCCRECHPIESLQNCTQVGHEPRRHNEEWALDDCARCTCDNGSIGCMGSSCLDPSCPHGFEIFDVPGQCCHECRERAACKEPDGKIRLHGEEWMRNCTSCFCDNGLEVCLQHQCPINVS